MCSSCHSINKLHKPHIINVFCKLSTGISKRLKKKKPEKQIFAKENNHRFIDSGLDGILKNTFQYLLRHHHPKTVPSENAVSQYIRAIFRKKLYLGLGPKCFPAAFKRWFSSCPLTEESSSFPTLQISENRHCQPGSHPPRLTCNFMLNSPASSINHPTRSLPGITMTSLTVLGCSGFQPRGPHLTKSVWPVPTVGRYSLMGSEPSVTKALPTTRAPSWRCKYATAQGQRNPTTEMLNLPNPPLPRAAPLPCDTC